MSESAPAIRRGSAGMRTFIVIFLAIHVPLFIYPVLRLGEWLEADLLVTWLVLVPVASSQVISRWLLRDARSPLVRGLRHLADFILGLSPILLMTLLLAEMLVAFKLVESGQAAVIVLVFAGSVAIAGVLFALVPVVKTVRFESGKLAQPLRFVQITDVHVGSRSVNFLNRVVATVQELQPDFLCITGDFIDARGVTEHDLAALRDLRCPIYFTIGNHERYEDLEQILVRLKNLGVQVLRTETASPRPGLQVLGIDDRDDALQVHRELGKMQVDRDAFSILMYHRPLGLAAAEAAGIDLMISGHTHNGQIFPFNLVVSRVFDQIVGMHFSGDTRLYISQGTGTWGPVMRVGTRSEITLFEITAKRKD